MSRNPADSMQYLEQVESFFLARRGRGLMLSPADAQVLRELEGAGVPAEVVCRGVARAFEAHAQRARPGDAGPRSVRACLGYIEAEAELWRSKEVGRNDWDPEREQHAVRERLTALLARVEAAGRASTGLVRDYYREAYRGVRDLLDAAEVAQVTRALQDLERRLLTDLLSALPPEQARDIGIRAERRVAARRGAISERAYRDALQSAQDAELRLALGLVAIAEEG